MVIRNTQERIYRMFTLIGLGLVIGGTTGGMPIAAIIGGAIMTLSVLFSASGKAKRFDGVDY
jgi:hypothetical protein